MRNYFSVLLLFVCVFSYAQSGREAKRFEISGSAGGPAGMLTSKGDKPEGVSFMADFKYTPVKWVSAGISFGAHVNEKAKCNVMAFLYGNWYTGERLKVYSAVGYGTMPGYTNGDDRAAWDFQITPVGVSYGRSLFGFVEAGTGWMFYPARAGIGWRF